MRRPRYRVVPATEEHVRQVAQRIRTADRAEIEAAGLRVDAAMAASLRASLWCSAAICRGWVICVWGVSPVSLIGGIGEPWLIGTDLMIKFRKSFLLESRRELKRMLRTFPVLRNRVSAVHEESIRWLAWLGFAIGPEHPWGAKGAPFRVFETGGDS
jgi:hypothetical protein